MAYRKTDLACYARAARSGGTSHSIGPDAGAQERVRHFRAAAGDGEANLDLEDIQGNIVPGFNKDYQAFMFVRFGERANALRWLRDMQAIIASAAEVDAFRTAYRSMKRRRPAQASDGRDGGALRGLSATWVNLALSFAGLRELSAAGALGRFPRQFRLNRMPGAAPEASAGIHAVIILGADHLQNLEAELERQRESMARYGVEEILLLRGATLPGDARGREHFGFKDGISQPLVAGTQWGSGPPVAAGEFILGYRDQSGRRSGDDLPEWTRNGSFMAFLQIEQHVDLFWNTMRQQAQQLGVAPDDLAAWIVGRRRDAEGTPVATTPTRVSHIGRGFSRWLPPDESLRHRLLRRGIPYGAPTSDERGLLFVAYQADVERQFEHVWAHWLNAPGFPAPGSGSDALVGQVNWPNGIGPARTRPASVMRGGRIGGPQSLSLPGFVTPRFGAYFFAPAIDALTSMARSTSA